MLNGYLERLQRPENLIWFFHDIVGIDAIEPVALEQRTNAYKARLRRIARSKLSRWCPHRTESARRSWLSPTTAG